MNPPPAGSGAAPEDTELVAAARRGDSAALDQLLRRHHDRILLLCRRFCRDRGDADDAAQNALIAIVRGLDRYDGRAAFSTWSHRVATNACLDELRRRGRRPVPAELPEPDERRLRDAPAGPEDAALAAEQRGRLQRALDQLSDDFRQPVVLRDVADLDYAEIAEILDLAPGTVRSRIAQGRAKLAALLFVEDPDGTGAISAEVSAPRDTAVGNQTSSADVRTADPP